MMQVGRFSINYDPFEIRKDGDRLSWGQVLTLLESQDQAVHALKSGRVDEVWEKLRVAMIHESQLNAALMKIATICGLSPGVPRSSENIVDKVESLVNYQHDASAKHQRVETLEAFVDSARAERDELRNHLMEVKRLACLGVAVGTQRNGDPAWTDVVAAVKATEGARQDLIRERDGLKAQRDRAEGTLESVRRELEVMIGQRDQLKGEREGLTYAVKETRTQRDILQLRVLELEKERDDRLSPGSRPTWEDYNAATAERDRMRDLVAAAAPLQADLQAARRERDHLKRSLEETAESAALDRSDLLKIGKLINAPLTAKFDEYPAQVQAALERRDQDLRQREEEILQLKADDSMGVVYKLGRHLQDIADILGFPKKVGAYTWEDVVERVKQVREHQHQQELLSRPKVTAGHLEEVMRRRLARQGGTPELCDVREMIIIALREAQVIS